jgi:hypothetical protein
MDPESLFSVRPREELMILSGILEMNAFKVLLGFMEIKLSMKETGL